jgi:hypothetical protein
MKNVYEFPLFFAELWNFVLQTHAKKMREVIDKLSEGGSKKGYVEIILIESENVLGTLES